MFLTNLPKNLFIPAQNVHNLNNLNNVYDFSAFAPILNTNISHLVRLSVCLCVCLSLSLYEENYSFAVSVGIHGVKKK